MKSRSAASRLEVLLVFLRLGCTSFGGPIAHLGYYRRELVERRRWCSEGTFAEIIAIAQSLPGPASSQTGFALGVVRAGWLGGIAAWIGFTLPSAALMFAFAYGHAFLGGSAGSALLHALQIVAVAVVAQAVLTMQRSLAPDALRLALAAIAACVVLFLPTHFATLIAIGLGALIGLAFFRKHHQHSSEPFALHLSRRAGVAAGSAFLLLLVLSQLLAHFTQWQSLQVFSAFYRSGALVFGGGHVVLPLLEDAVVASGWVTQQAFLAGYGAAQALPGPLFAFAAYLGAVVHAASSPLLYGLLGLIGIFAPGLLAMAAVLPFWSAFRDNIAAQAALKGINSSVVGILLAAFIHPLWSFTIHLPSDLCFALLAFAMLVLWKLPSWIVVISTVAAYMLFIRIA
jgi:chromate transporter